MVAEVVEETLVGGKSLGGGRDGSRYVGGDGGGRDCAGGGSGEGRWQRRRWKAGPPLAGMVKEPVLWNIINIFNINHWF